MPEIQIVLDTASPLLNRILRQAITTTPLMTRIGGIGIRSIHSVFEMEGDPRWRPSNRVMGVGWGSVSGRKVGSPFGAVSPWAGLGGYKTLQISGALKMSHQITNVAPTFVDITAKKIYAATHQYGRDPIPATFTSKLGKSYTRMLPTIPARPFLKITDKYKEQMGNEIVRHLIRTTK